METIVVTSQLPFSLETVAARLAAVERVEYSEDRALVVHGETSRAYLHTDVGSIAGVHRLLLDYSDLALAKRILERIADHPAVIIDNDFGVVLRGDLFMKRWRDHVDWDWRRP